MFFATFKANFGKAMASKVTEGVTVTVETFYQPDYSNPVSGEFMFAYRITLQNNNAFPVKLLRRHWYIFDSNGTQREVEGEGLDRESETENPGRTCGCGKVCSSSLRRAER